MMLLLEQHYNEVVDLTRLNWLILIKCKFLKIVFVLHGDENFIEHTGEIHGYSGDCKYSI